jgi:hypothetical protein
MAVVKGRSSNETRSVTITTTNTSPAITAAAGTFNKGDVGAKVTATGVTAGTTITAVASDTAATLSANATASGSPTATPPEVITAPNLPRTDFERAR